MGHFAKIENNKVVSVIVAEQDYIDGLVRKNPNEIWVKTSYNTAGGIHFDNQTGLPSTDQSKALRKNYAGIDYYYCNMRDAFIPPKPFSSWELNETTCNWIPPIPYPSNRLYVEENNQIKIAKIKWTEENTTWIGAEGITETDILKKQFAFRFYWDTEASVWKLLSNPIIEKMI